MLGRLVISGYPIKITFEPLAAAPPQVDKGEA